MASMHYSLINPHAYGILRSCLILLLFMADIATMSYIYKSYYGRLIINELVETDNESDFNKKEYIYKKKTVDNVIVEKDISELGLPANI